MSDPALARPLAAGEVSMSLTATCPACATRSPVPEQAIGKKVRCKSCGNVFVVVADPPAPPPPEVPAQPPPRPAAGSPKVPPPGSGGPSARPRTTPRSSEPATFAPVTFAPVQKSHVLLWSLLGVLTVIATGGITVVVYLLMHPGPAPSTTEANPSKQEAQAPAQKNNGKDVRADEDEPADKQPEKTASPIPPKEPEPIEFKSIEPVALAPLLHSQALDYPALADVQELIPVAGHPTLIGLKATEKGEIYFELHDLAKPARLAKIKLPKNATLCDVAPDGSVVAVADAERKIHVFDLPGGKDLLGAWAPYSNAKDAKRFLRDGRITALALLAKTRLLVLTSHNSGDIWELPKKAAVQHLPPTPRKDFRRETAVAGRDIALSPDRKWIAFAGDGGIELHDAQTYKPLGKTEKLTTFGAKPELAGMGFYAGGTKLSVYLSAGPDGARGYRLVHFKVPEGTEAGVEEVAEPVPTAIAYVGGDLFLSAERQVADLRDGKGRTVAVCAVAGKTGLFAPHVVGGKLAFAYAGAKEKPTLGLVDVPTSAAPAKTTTGASKNLAALLTGAPTKAEAKTRVFEKQELWEFGARGVLKKGERALSAK